MPDDVHTLSGAYAVDALDDAERGQFESHLAQCATCWGEVDSLREAAALMAETTLTHPSAQLRERVLGGIATVRPLPPALDEPAEQRPAGATVTTLADHPTHRRRRVTTFLAAAAAVVAIGTGGVVVHGLSNDGPKSEQQQVMAASDRQTYTQHLTNGATATIYRSPKLNEAVLVTKGMPSAPSGREYALWLLHGNTMVPAGVLPAGRDNEVVLSGDATSATGAGITIERADTTPSTPSDDQVMNVGFRTA